MGTPPRGWYLIYLFFFPEVRNISRLTRGVCSELLSPFCFKTSGILAPQARILRFVCTSGPVDKQITRPSKYFMPNPLQAMICMLAFIRLVATSASPGPVIVSCFRPKSLSPSTHIGLTISLPIWGTNISTNTTSAVLHGGIEVMQNAVDDRERGAVLLLQGPLNLTHNGTKNGTFSVSTVLTNLNPNTTYYLSARASDDVDYLQLIGWGEPGPGANCSTTPQSAKSGSEISSSVEPTRRRSNFQSAIDTVPSRYLPVYRMTECAPSNRPDYLDNKVTQTNRAKLEVIRIISK